MQKISIETNENLKETTFIKKLDNGLSIYVCKKGGFNKKIGVFGTKYGSIYNDFVDIETNNRTKVPDGIAHFLEHKLFEKEGENALDMFAKKGVYSNAYTSFDHTVYYFETVDKFEESLDMLVELVKKPYFTDENVQKEMGIISQEISMYDDEPNFVVYFNALKAMYINHPVKIDIAGTIDSINKITKEILYTCYNTFYSMRNMFFIVVGDVDVEATFKQVEQQIKKYGKPTDIKAGSVNSVETFFESEPHNINKREIIKNMEVFMPLLCLGYKLAPTDIKENIKREILSSIIEEMYFSKISPFYKLLYERGLTNETIGFNYEYSSNFSHLIITASSRKIKEMNDLLKDYLDKIINQEVDIELFETIKKKKIGQKILGSDNMDNSFRRVIFSAVENSDIYSDYKTLLDITVDDLRSFLKILDDKYQVTSMVLEKSIKQ